MSHDEFVWREFERFRGRPWSVYGVPEVVIDDADRLLQRLVSSYAMVRVVTMSKPFSKAECLKFGVDPQGTRT